MASTCFKSSLEVCTVLFYTHISGLSDCLYVLKTQVVHSRTRQKLQKQDVSTASSH